MSFISEEHKEPDYGSMEQTDTAALGQRRRSGRLNPRLRRRKSKTDKPSASSSPPAKKTKRTHSWLFSMLNPRSNKPQARVFKAVATFLILVSLGIYIASTLPEFTYERTVYFIEAVTSSVFMLEWILRGATITESRRYSGCGGRAKYFCSVGSLIDIVSCAPFFLEFAFQTSLPNLTGLRVFRVFRILKTSALATALGTAYRVLWFNSEILLVSLLICAMLMLVTSVVMYYAGPAPAPDNVGEFESIPATMFISVMMLTGQGNPTGVMPWYTQIIIAINCIFSIGMFIIPASMLTWGFEAEAERLMQKQRDARKAQRLRLEHAAATGEVLEESEPDSTSSDGEAQAAWDEYEKVVLGSESDEDSNTLGMQEPPEWMKQVMARLDEQQARTAELQKGFAEVNSKLALILRHKQWT